MVGAAQVVEDNSPAVDAGCCLVLRLPAVAAVLDTPHRLFFFIFTVAVRLLFRLTAYVVAVAVAVAGLILTLTWVVLAVAIAFDIFITPLSETWSLAPRSRSSIRALRRLISAAIVDPLLSDIRVRMYCILDE